MDSHVVRAAVKLEMQRRVNMEMGGKRWVCMLIEEIR